MYTYTYTLRDVFRKPRKSTFLNCLGSIKNWLQSSTSKPNSNLGKSLFFRFGLGSRFFFVKSESGSWRVQMLKKNRFRNQVLENLTPNVYNLVNRNPEPQPERNLMRQNWKMKNRTRQKLIGFDVFGLKFTVSRLYCSNLNVYYEKFYCKNYQNPSKFLIFCGGNFY